MSHILSTETLQAYNSRLLHLLLLLKTSKMMKSRLRLLSSPFSENYPSCLLRGGTFHLLFPMLACLQCPINNCKRDFITKAWTATKRSVQRHIYEDHMITITQQRYWCDICKDIIASKRIKYHQCLTRIDVVKIAERYRYPCKMCHRSFHSQKGWFNHQKVCRRQQLNTFVIQI